MNSSRPLVQGLRSEALFCFYPVRSPAACGRYYAPKPPTFGIFIGIVLLCALLVTACSTSAPRFRAPEPKGDRIVQEDDEFRFASKIKEEESREDDRKVDVKKMKKELTSPGFPPPSRINLTPKGLNRDRVLLDVVSYLGAPYRFGGADKTGIDCSALTANVYASATGRQLPRSTAGQYELGDPVSKDSLEFGDLVFFNTTGHSPSHVGIFIEDELFAHASLSFGVTISSLESTYYRNRYVGARRIVQ